MLPRTVSIRLFSASARFIFACLLAITELGVSHAGLNGATNNLPINPTPQQPAFLLELGSAPSAPSQLLPGVQIVQGQALPEPQTGVSWQVEPDAVNVLHAGFGAWPAAFRFNLTQPAAGDFKFWARWRQGGEPTVCVQILKFGRDRMPASWGCAAALR